jgi:eukaryotic-like serine/threonine-protein kinase
MQEQSLFIEVLEKQDPAARAAFLDQACAGDGALRERIERLLQRHQQAGGFLESPAPQFGATVDEPIRERPGSVIGPYKLLEQIGEGGFGVVFMAEQQEPIRRKVALKVLKPGMDTRQVVARFEAERQALAIMDHANIAKVFDGGATESGRPYFVMELVRGVPITKYCDEHRLTPRQRLELFIPVCQAVQHAHQKGVIHRDLKPSNVLVALYDGKPVPKVIDFGVAKAAGPRLTGRTLFTEFGAVVGTLEYMSPEQAELNQLDIDTRSDIYSLGVLLYELLTGTTPLERRRLKGTGLLEALRLIREEETPRPSARLSTTAELPAVAASRGLEPKKLSGAVRGELDWIVMKALEKDRSRRYETANAFAADVQHYLNDEAVEACPPSTLYTLRKLVRRHKRAFATGCFVAAVLTAAAAGLGVSYAQVQEEQHKTEAALGRETRATKALAEALADRERSLYVQLIASAAYERARNHAARAEELLEQCPPKWRGWEWDYLKRLPFADFPTLRHGDDADVIVTDVAYSPDGRLLASGGLDGVVKVWDARTGKGLLTLRAAPRFVRGLALSPDNRLLAGGGEDKRVKVWDATTGALLHEFSIHGGVLEALAFSPDGSRLAASDQDRFVQLWDVPTGREVWFLQDDGLPARRGLAFRADGRQLVAVGSNGIVKVRDVANPRTAAAIDGQVPYTSVAAFSLDRRLVALGGEDGRIKVWQLEPWKLVAELPGETHEIIALAFGAADQRLASTADARDAKIWNLTTGQETLTLDSLHSRRLNALAFSPDGLRLASGGADGAVKVSDGTPWAESGQDGQALVLGGHEHHVVGVAFSPDGGRLASASRDQTVKVWDARTGRELLTLRGGQAPFTGVAFDPNGSRVAASNWDGTVRIWDANTGRNSFASGPTAARSTAWRSARTAAHSPPPTTTARRGSGTPTRGGNGSPGD